MNYFLTLDETLSYQHRSRSSHLRDVRNGVCTKPVRLGPRSDRWIQPELEQIRKARIAGFSEEKIKSLVDVLHEEREKDAKNLLGDLL